MVYSSLFPRIIGILLLFNTKPVISGSPEFDRRSNDNSDTNVVSKAPNILNVHLVPHTHDDVGWLKTVDQYYQGLNNTIQHANVRAILDTTIQALEENPDRKFTYVEQAFFTLWWAEQDEAKRNSVKKLVSEGRLSFVNGGWCMHDEAATHFMGMIDQTTLGHSFLKETFDFTPRVGWQIDPFGHSATQASLLSAEAGFDALYFGRIDYQDLTIRKKTSQCEGMWQSSKSLGEDAEVFWGLTGSYRGNYGWPSGFCFDINCNDEPIDDGINTPQRISDFIKEVSKVAAMTRGNNIMLTLGSDFNYQNASYSYRNIEFLLAKVNEYQANGKIDSESLGRFDKINLFYSNPEMYTFAKHDEGIDWKVKEDDFFPYSDCPNCFWTGYFTSRASLKRLERVGSSFLHAARQIEAVDNIETNEIKSSLDSPLYNLDAAVGIAQHHDGVSGTSKQHVAYDYAKRLDSGIKEASSYVTKTLNKLLGGSANLSYCQLLNETICDVSQAATIDFGTDLYVVAYNALSSSREEIISVPVAADATYVVYRVDEEVSNQIPVTSVLMQSHNPSKTQEAAGFILHVETGNIPALGAIILRIEMVSTESSKTHPSTDFAPACRRERENVRGSKEQDRSTADIFNGKLNFIFDKSTGVLKGMRDKTNGSYMDVSMDWGYYTSYAGPGQASGAYIFRPSKQDGGTLMDQQCDSTIVYQTDLVTEVHSQFSSWVKQITRVKKGQPYLEVEYSVGPIPIADGKGREPFIRYKSSVKNDGVFYTDSNGREFLERKLSFRPTWDLEEFQPIAGNYYPVNAAIYIQDDDSSMGVLTDRSQGGSSLTDGTIELMVHRRTVEDDARGVAEPLDETDGGMTPYPPYGDNKRLGEGIIVRGTHRILFGEGNDGASTVRSGMDKSFSSPHLFFSSSSSRSGVPFQKGSFSALESALPENVMLITYAKIHSKPGTFLIRLGHQYGTNEGVLSSPVTVSLVSLFSGQKVAKVVEMTLTGNQERSSWESKRLSWKTTKKESDRKYRLFDDGTLILNPMEIRTFEVTLENKKFYQSIS
eukprot:CAMPEP_0195539222 /NCGR_PEP_ID=MMETSP0794_2-20130614/49941_1 /TAXON_ID=515487 /ORGANISM="Stephanopyxis turris, Strain CCMP 815" /LENGTH=1047 /DNA_ID=CAMNT_0040673245 /DNA_START=100 /DNA_END=3243 /DNA_ORIENTATION=+